MLEPVQDCGVGFAILRSELDLRAVVPTQPVGGGTDPLNACDAASENESGSRPRPAPRLPVKLPGLQRPTPPSQPGRAAPGTSATSPLQPSSSSPPVIIVSTVSWLRMDGQPQMRGRQRTLENTIVGTSGLNAHIVTPPERRSDIVESARALLPRVAELAPE